MPLTAVVAFLFLSLANSYPYNNFDPTGELVTFYPSSLFLSRSPRALAFFADAKLVHLAIKLKPISMVSTPKLNIRCSASDNAFLSKLLDSVSTVQRSIRRLLSMPGYSNLIECDSYLRRFYQYSTGLSPLMSCPRIYKSSLSQCQKWALQNCRGISPDERVWLQPPSRTRRSSWLCHAGFFGILRKIYTATGHSCDSNTVSNLHSTLRQLTNAMSNTQSLIHSVNGKVVYLIKTTDNLNTKLTSVIGTLHEIDSTLADWAQSLANFSQAEQCHHHSLLEFMSHFSTSTNRAFYSLLRLNEIQDTLNQITHLTQKTLVGFSQLPRFITTEISARLDTDQSMSITTKALKEGFPLLINPFVNIEHTGKQLDVSVLFTIPEISSLNSFCTVELLSPIKYNILGTCYSGPISYDNLALITCSNTRSLVKIESLAKCFQQENTLLCPTNILQTIHDIEWLGFPWKPASQVPFHRNHDVARDCTNLNPFIHLGGRYYLATSSGTIHLNTGPLKLSPQAIYHFPCNTTFFGMATGLGSCPQTMNVAIPIFQPHEIKYVPWTPTHDDSAWNQHYRSLNITKPLKLEHNLLKQLDDTYMVLDNQLSQQLQSMQARIDSIHDVSTSTVNDICTYVALTITLVHTVLVIMYLCRNGLRANFHNCLPRNTSTTTNAERIDEQIELSGEPCSECCLPQRTDA